MLERNQLLLVIGAVLVSLYLFCDCKGGNEGYAGGLAGATTRFHHPNPKLNMILREADKSIERAHHKGNYKRVAESYLGKSGLSFDPYYVRAGMVHKGTPNPQLYRAVENLRAYSNKPVRYSSREKAPQERRYAEERKKPVNLISWGAGARLTSIAKRNEEVARVNELRYAPPPEAFCGCGGSSDKKTEGEESFVPTGPGCGCEAFSSLSNGTSLERGNFNQGGKGTPMRRHEGVPGGDKFPSHHARSSQIYDLLPHVDRDRPITIAFGVEWCEHCRRLKPVWEKVMHAMQVGDSQLLWVDCEANPNLCQVANISSYPSILKVYPSGQVILYTGQRLPQEIIRFAKFDYGR